MFLALSHKNHLGITVSFIGDAGQTCNASVARSAAQRFWIQSGSKLIDDSFLDMFDAHCYHNNTHCSSSNRNLYKQFHLCV